MTSGESLRRGRAGCPLRHGAGRRVGRLRPQRFPRLRRRAGRRRRGQGAGRQGRLDHEPQAARRPGRRGPPLWRQRPRLDQGQSGRVAGPMVKFLSDSAGPADGEAGLESGTSPCSWPTRRTSPTPRWDACGCTWAASSVSSTSRGAASSGDRLPAFEHDPQEGRYMAMHHPFTSPKPDHLAFLRSGRWTCAAMLTISCSTQRDRRGSIRIHDTSVQERVFRLLGIDRKKHAPSSASSSTPFATARPPRRPGLRPGPAGRHLDRRGIHPRGHCLPQDPEGGLPDDRGASTWTPPSSPTWAFAHLGP